MIRKSDKHKRRQQSRVLSRVMTNSCLIVALYPISGSLALQQQRIASRRRLLEAAAWTASSWCLLDPKAANAAKGAAEYDFEYYMRDLLGGNAKQGNVVASKPPPAPAPRALQGPLLPLLLNDDCNPTCVPTQALLKQVKASISPEEIMSRMEEYRSKASRSFAARAPWASEHVADQYYFDLTSYALWRTAADLIPDYRQRDIFVRDVGRGILERMVDQKLVSTNLLPNKDSSLVSTVPSVLEVLRRYRDARYCKGFRIGDAERSDAVFDELDDQDIQSGASVNCLVSIYEPATLGASLQITGEQSRFTPEYVGSTLAALWEIAGLKVSYDTYFVDPEYRPNPKDYFPDEQLLQFTLTKN